MGVEMQSDRTASTTCVPESQRAISTVKGASRPSSPGAASLPGLLWRKSLRWVATVEEVERGFGLDEGGGAGLSDAEQERDHAAGREHAEFDRPVADGAALGVGRVFVGEEDAEGVAVDTRVCALDGEGDGTAGRRGRAFPDAEQVGHGGLGGWWACGEVAEPLPSPDSRRGCPVDSKRNSV